MSTALAIASVTAVLKDLLHNGVIDHDLASTVGEIRITALAPDLVRADSFDGSRLNLFMYMVTPNAAWRNAVLPTYDDQGVRVSNPPLALDLHYLLTAYGAEDFHSEILLGYAMQLLHEHPVLTRSTITTALVPQVGVGVGPSSTLPAALKTLNASDLVNQVEQIRITPEAMSTEEMSRLWSAVQTHYRPTAAYRASVVLIESNHRVKASTPALTPSIYAAPASQIQIQRVDAAAGPGFPILPGEEIAVSGDDLQGEITEVLVDGTLVDPARVVRITPSRIRLTLPVALEAGIHGVQVVHSAQIGTPPVTHRVLQSNVVAFALHPAVKLTPGGGPPPYQVDVAGVTGSGTDPRSASITVRVRPDLLPGQRVQLEMLREGALVATFVGPTPAVASDAVTFRVSNLAAGEYVVRVRVDGVESMVDFGPNRRPSEPKVKL
jgi:hypothetical protein